MCTPEGFLFPLCWGPWLHKRCEVILCTSPHAVREQGRQVPWLTSVFAGLRQQTMSTPLLLTSIALVQLSTVQSLSHVRLRDPMNQSTPGLPAHHQLPEFTQTHVHWVSDAIQRSHPLSFPSCPQSFPRISVFSNELALCTMWPKYWSFSISPSSEYSGLISFRNDLFNLLAAQGTLKSLLQHHSSKVSIL